MGKIQGNYNYNPEDDELEEGAEERPAFEPENNDEEEKPSKTCPHCGKNIN